MISSNTVVAFATRSASSDCAISEALAPRHTSSISPLVRITPPHEVGLQEACMVSSAILRVLMTKDAARLVLVVEDDVSVRRPLVKFLEMHGFAVVTAETADEGLDALRRIRWWRRSSISGCGADRDATSSPRRRPTCR